MANVEIFEQDLKKGHLAIIRGGLGERKSFMDEVVYQYVQSKHNGGSYNDFIEVTLDNPYVRVIITGINELEYKDFIFDSK